MTTTVFERSAVSAGHEPDRATTPYPPIQIFRRTEVERQRYEDLLALPTGELRERAAQEIRAELDLPLEAQREAVHARLAAWLELEPENARILARTWDEAAAGLSEDEARRRFEAERDSMLHGFRFQDFTRFAEFMPWLRSEFGLAMFGQPARAA